MDKEPLQAHSSQTISLNVLQGKSLRELTEKAQERNIRMRTEVSRHHLVLDLVRSYLLAGEPVLVEGILELNGDQGILRSSLFNFKPGVEDVQVPHSILRQYQLKPGLKISGNIRLPAEKERGLILESISMIEEISVSEWVVAKDFEKLTPLFPPVSYTHLTLPTIYSV